MHPGTVAVAPGAIVLRPEREADGAFLSGLFAATHGAPFAGLDPASRTLLLRQGFAGQAAGYRAAYPRARFEIVERGGLPVGRLVTDRGPGAITIVDIALGPEHRGQGLGTGLLHALQDEARAAGRAVRLSVGADNGAARRLYERLGFAVSSGSELHHAMEWSAS